MDWYVVRIDRHAKKSLLLGSCVFGVPVRQDISNSSCPQRTREIRQPERQKHPVVDSQLLDGKRALPAFPKDQGPATRLGIKQSFGTTVGVFIDPFRLNQSC